jgi:hypothetical protein
MIDRIGQITRLLKNGSVKNVTSYGNNKLGMPAPYCVIVPAAAPPDREAFQIWAHFQIGYNKELEAYVKEELPALMKEELDNCGAPLFETNKSYDGVSLDTTDNTLRAGKAFFLPLVIY